MNAALRVPFTQCFRQRGAAALMTLVFLLIVVGMAVVVALKLSGSDVYDTASQQNSVQALFLAESATERAAARLGGGTACASLAPDTGNLGSGSYSVTSAAVVGPNCQIRVSGTVGSATRTADAVLSNAGGGAISADPNAPITPSANSGTSRTLSYTVPAGASILLVGLSINNTTANVTVTYAGTNMILGPTASAANPFPRSQIYYLVNPPAGTANVVANFTQNSEAVLGATWFSGVNTATGATAPFDVAAVTQTGTGGSKTATLNITPVTSGAWIFEVVAIDQNDVTTMTPRTNRVMRWFAQSNGNVRGGASTIGPISPAAMQTPSWTWLPGNNAKWAQAAVALRPSGGAPKVVQWTEVVQ